MLTTAYLWLNALLYAVFAALCAARVGNTSRALGYRTLSPSGVSEYVTVYGGLQVGLAIGFAAAAITPELRQGGLLLAVALYAPIAVFRWISVLKQWPVEKLTLAVGGLEAALLAGAIALWIENSV